MPIQPGKAEAKQPSHESNCSIPSSGNKHNWSVLVALESCQVVQRCSAAPPPRAALAPAVLEQRHPMTRTIPLPDFLERPGVQSPQAPAVLGPGSYSWARTVGKICGCRCLHFKAAMKTLKCCTLAGSSRAMRPSNLPACTMLPGPFSDAAFPQLLASMALSFS